MSEFGTVIQVGRSISPGSATSVSQEGGTQRPPYLWNLIYSFVVNTFSGLDTKTEILDFRPRDLDKMNSSALESRDHGLENTSLAASIPIGDKALA